MRLTAQQQAVVNHTYGPALVFAVAGAGKTTALEQRIVRLVAERVFAPQRILAAAYNLAVKDELGTRLRGHEGCAAVEVLTLHALGLRAVRLAWEAGLLPTLKRNAFGEMEDAQETLLNAAMAEARRRKAPYQRELAGKGHERTTALALVQELDLTGVLLSADALHTQAAWCQQVRRQGGDYLLIVKANQRLLRSDIALLFREEPRAWLPEQSTYQVNQGHGRLEVRTIRTSSQLNDYITPKWTDVAQVFQLQRRITRRQRTTTETVYGITSLAPQVAPPRRLLHFIRQYWQIENRLH